MATAPIFPKKETCLKAYSVDDTSKPILGTPPPKEIANEVLYWRCVAREQEEVFSGTMETFRPDNHRLDIYQRATYATGLLALVFFFLCIYFALRMWKYGLPFR